MNAYYLSLLKEIQKQMDDKCYYQAYDMIHQELEMPYVPKEVLEVLEVYQKECLIHMDKPIRSPDDEQLVSWIHGDELQMEKAVSELENRNLRNYYDEVQSLLNSNLMNEFKGELIEALMAQKIDDSYTMEKNGLEITFVPSAIVSRDDDVVLNETQEYFDVWFSNDNPAFKNFCDRLLEQEILEVRPFDFTDYEPIVLAKAIVKLVMDAFGQSEQFAAFETIQGLQDVADMPLEIERRGENND